jgi:hypothetical protein
MEPSNINSVKVWQNASYLVDYDTGMTYDANINIKYDKEKKKFVTVDK